MSLSNPYLIALYSPTCHVPFLVYVLSFYSIGLLPLSKIQYALWWLKNWERFICSKCFTDLCYSNNLLQKLLSCLGIGIFKINNENVKTRLVTGTTELHRIHDSTTWYYLYYSQIRYSWQNANTQCTKYGRTLVAIPLSGTVESLIVEWDLIADVWIGNGSGGCMSLKEECTKVRTSLWSY